MEIALIISILSITFTIINFVLSRKDKSNKDVENTSYKQGQLDAQLKSIFEKLDKIEKKLDSYDKELDEKIDKAIENHIKLYHLKGE